MPPPAAYFIPATVNQLRTVEDLPYLRGIRPPDGMYTSAKMGKSRARGDYGSDIHGGGGAGAGCGPAMSVHAQPYPAYASYPHSPGSPTAGSPTAYRDVQGCWPAPSPPRDGQYAAHPSRVLPALPSPLAPLSIGLAPSPSVQSPYSPRHPLDDEALRSLNRSL